MATDPDIDATWHHMRAAIRAILQPYVQDALVEERVTDIADWLNANGWKPPILRINPLIAAGRAARDQAARKEQQ
ncbi:hypothetical protein [Nonomuraea angiospora]